MIDHAGTEKCFTVFIERDAPWIAGAFRKDLKLACPRVDAEQDARHWPARMVCLEVWITFGITHVAVVEDSVQAVQPAVRSPGQRVRQFVRVVTSEAGNNHLSRAVGNRIAISIRHEQDVRRIRDPHAAMSDSDSAGDIEAIQKDRHLVGLAVTSGVFQNFDTVTAGARFAAGIFERLGNPEPPAFVDRHRDRVYDVWFRGDDLDREAFGHGHLFDGFLGRQRRSWRFVMTARNLKPLSGRIST